MKRQLADEKAATVRDFRVLQRILGVQPAEQGNAQAQAQCDIGDLKQDLKLAADLKQDLKLAATCYQMAADSKDPKEAVFLYQQAEFWYKMAGDQGHAQQARRNLERLQGISLVVGSIYDHAHA